jgi:hypothetical protein
MRAITPVVRSRTKTSKKPPTSLTATRSVARLANAITLPSAEIAQLELRPLAGTLPRLVLTQTVD